MTVRTKEGQNACNGIIRGVSLHDDRNVRYPMGEDGRGSKCILKGVESAATGVVEVPRRVLARQAREWNDKVGVIMDETAIEIGEAKEGLDVLHLAWFRPFHNSGNFVRRHCETGRGEAVAKIFNRFSVPFTFVGRAE